MEIIILIALTTIPLSIGVFIGWIIRERDFQKYPIIFKVGNSNAAQVDNKSGPKTKITIYDKKLVEITK